MSRAAFNTTGAVYTGFAAFPPFEYKFSTPCRLVPNERTLLMGSTWLEFTHYVNWDDDPVVPGETVFDTDHVNWEVMGADLWEIPEGSGDFYLTLYVATINTPRPGDSPYRRAWLLSIGSF